MTSEWCVVVGASCFVLFGSTHLVNAKYEARSTKYQTLKLIKPPNQSIATTPQALQQFPARVSRSVRGTTRRDLPSCNAQALHLEMSRLASVPTFSNCVAEVVGVSDGSHR